MADINPPVGTIVDGGKGIIHIDGWHCLDNTNGCPACSPCDFPCPVCIASGDQTVTVLVRIIPKPEYITIKITPKDDDE